MGKYIQFAIDSWLECENFFRMRKDNRFLYHKNKEWKIYQWENTIEEITSKEFIEAIARGITIEKWKELYTEEFLEMLASRTWIAIMNDKMDDWIEEVFEYCKD